MYHDELVETQARYERRERVEREALYVPAAGSRGSIRGRRYELRHPPRLAYYISLAYWLVGVCVSVVGAGG